MEVRCREILETVALKKRRDRCGNDEIRMTVIRGRQKRSSAGGPKLRAHCGGMSGRIRFNLPHRSETSHNGWYVTSATLGI